MCVEGGEGRGSVGMDVCTCVCVGVNVFGCDCAGEEGSVWV